MKFTILIISLIAVAVIVVACKRQGTDATPPSTGAVVFEGSGVSLVPGDEWERIDRGSFAGATPPGVCLPTLAGKAGLIQVLLLPSDRSDPQTVAAGLRAAFDANPKSIKDSFRQESITIPGGAQVLYVTYREQSEGDAPEGRIHTYIVKNREGRGVAIDYIANSRIDSNAVHQMIRQTLRVE